MLGVNQRLLLQRCTKQGFLTAHDASIYYPSLHNGRKLLAVLERLELLGYLEAIHNNRFVLSDKGKKLIEGLKIK